MPNTLSAKKKVRADIRKAAINRRIKGKIKVATKEYANSPTLENLSRVFSALDVASKKRVIPKGQADRKKSRLSVQVKTAKKTVTKKKTKRVSKKAKAG